MTRFGRAFLCITRFVFKGFGLHTLQDGFPQIRAGCEQLRHQHARLRDPKRRRCKCCGKFMLCPGLMAADAGQAYEALDIKKVRLVLAKLWSKAKADRSCDSVTVVHGEPYSRGVRRSGGRVTRSTNCSVIFVRSLARAIDAYLGVHRYNQGDLLFCQQAGLPIGGPYSGGILDCVLNCCEASFSEKFAWFLLDVVAVRYVDDILFASFAYCRSCLFSFVKRIYGDTVSFDLDKRWSVNEEQGCAIQPYLDGTIYLSWEGVHVGYQHTNQDYAFGGKSTDIAKHNFLPYTGNLSRHKKLTVKAEIKGKLLRWGEISSCATSFYLCIIC